MNAKRHTRVLSIVVGFTVGLIIGLVAAPLVTGESQAHVPRPEACEIAWEQAPPGAKWAAQQRCVAAQIRHTCVTHGRSVPGTVRVKGQRLAAGHSRYWRNQRHVIGWIVNEGLRRNLSRTVVLAAIVATTQESSARERPDGHGTSVGPFQLIDDHGTFEQRKSVEFSGNWFYNGALKELRRLGPMSSPTLAQEVEESAYPSEYAQWLPEAKRTLAAVLGPCRLRAT